MPVETSEQLPSQIPVPAKLPFPAATSRSRSRAPTIAEPSEEPTVPSGRQSPHTTMGDQLTDEPLRPRLQFQDQPWTQIQPHCTRQLTPKPSDSEGPRFNRQETLSFRPVRRQRPQGAQPYDPDPPPTADPGEEHAPAANADPDLTAAKRAPEHALINHAFQEPKDSHKGGSSKMATSCWTNAHAATGK